MTIFPNGIDSEFTKLIDTAIVEALKKRGRVNILVAGKTGVGKSTLVNSVFQSDLATTGFGKPVTTCTREIRKDGLPVSIFDTRGLELQEFEQTLRELTRLIHERARRDDPNEHIHFAWLCISEDSRRVEEAEIRLCNLLVETGLPVIAVITKARADNGFRAAVQQLLPRAGNVVRVRAIAEELEDGHRLEPKGLRELVDLTMEIVPQAQKNAFVAAQKVTLWHKQEQAHKVVALAGAAAGGAAAAPIPFSDFLALVPIQVGMLSSVSAVFGLPLSTLSLTTLAGSILVGSAGTLGGRALVSNILLLIPGAGWATRAGINAATASTFTIAFGEAYIRALSFLIEKDPHNPPTAEEIGRQLKTELGRMNPFAEQKS
ncbi:GTP-binding protein [Verrucomicrobia bacterium LW23]|nr:GTP-binding protein [Verrucomicrobia bacterium LW23]